MNFEEPKTLMSFLSSKKESGMYKASIIRRFEELFESHPDIKMGEIIHYILKSTGDLSSSVNWTDKNFLNKLENVQRQISDSYNEELSMFTKNDENIDAIFLQERINKNPKVYGQH